VSSVVIFLTGGGDGEREKGGNVKEKERLKEN
jgi:hypothetical protein